MPKNKLLRFFYKFGPLKKLMKPILLKISFIKWILIHNRTQKIIRTTTSYDDLHKYEVKLLFKFKKLENNFY